jgi:hypothetical protein
LAFARMRPDQKTWWHPPLIFLKITKKKVAYEIDPA